MEGLGLRWAIAEGYLSPLKMQEDGRMEFVVTDKALAEIRNQSPHADAGEMLDAFLRRHALMGLRLTTHVERNGKFMFWLERWKTFEDFAESAKVLDFG